MQKGQTRIYGVFKKLLRNKTRNEMGQPGGGF